MKKYLFIISLITITLYSCSKEEGEGGRSSISGKIHMTDVHDVTGVVQSEYDAPDYDVFIIYGDKDNVYDDKMKTNYDGTFTFSNLRKGSYRVFAYSQDLTDPSGVKAVFASAEIGGNEEVSVGTIEVER